MSAYSYVRKPRVEILIDKEPIGLLECAVDVSRHARADTFTGITPLAASGRDLGEWAILGPVNCTVRARNDEGDAFITLLTGQLDKAEVVADRRGVVVEFTGRDKTAKLLDSRRTKKDPNKKASEIVKEIAEKHGLKVEIDTTDDDAGKQHTDETVHLVHNDSDWNTLTRLAEREGAFLYLKGDTLYFKQPSDDAQGLEQYPILFRPPTEDEIANGNVTTIRLVNNCHLKRGIKQTVRSYHTRKEKNVTTTKAPEGNSEDPLEWVDEIPGLTDAQVEKIATKRQIEKRRHEMPVQVEMPGDVYIDARMMLAVSGTGSAFDQTYHIDTISHRFGGIDGYHMFITAKNKRGGDTGDGRSATAATDAAPDGAGPSAMSEAQGPQQPRTVPLPPGRPSGL